MTRLAAAAWLVVAMTAQAQLQVVAGTYGGNCGAPRGNKTPALAESCNGKPSCTYRIDHRVIGDPAVGCGKTYVAEWRCPGQDEVRSATVAPEAGLGRVVTLDCTLRPVEPPAPGKAIQVLEGTAGTNCGGAGAYTDSLARACNGRQRCQYWLEFAPMEAKCLKDFVAKWRCGDEQRTSAWWAQAGAKSITLSCEAPAPAPAPPSKGVQIVSATYGAQCGAPAGNVSAVVAAACNGKGACPYVVDWQVIGDPAYGCGKDFRVEWRCGGSAKIAALTIPGEAGFKKTALISCQ